VRRELVTPFLLALSCTSSTPDDAQDGCAPTTPAEAAACVDADRFTTDLQTLAVNRVPGSDGWQAAQDLCSTVFTDLGFDVELHDYGTGINVVGTLKGTGGSKQTYVVSAHYDSVANCSGADDNASGVAGTLEVARALATGTWTHDLIVACWDQEEAGLVGSRAYAKRAANQGTPITAALSLEMIAYADDTPNSQELPFGFDIAFPEASQAAADREFRGDFLALISDPDANPIVTALVEHAPESLPVIRIDITEALLNSPLIDDLTRSDHAAFWEQGLPAVMLTDTANFRYAGYHCGDADDTIDRLDLDFAADVTRAVAAGVADVLEASVAE
jgi:Zn-dependent M28 family amino/carboxypeptidase